MHKALWWRTTIAITTAVVSGALAAPMAAQADPGPVTAPAAASATPDLSHDGLTWRVELASDAPQDLSAWVSFCTGTFYGPTKIRNTLEWGAQQTCENPLDRPHAIIGVFQ